jgi:hypothetical protein
VTVPHIESDQTGRKDQLISHLQRRRVLVVAVLALLALDLGVFRVPGQRQEA